MIFPVHEQSARLLVLLVEDDDNPRRSLQLFLTGLGYRVRAFSTVEQALGDPTPDEAVLLVANHHLPDGDGIRLLNGLRGRGWSGRAVLVATSPSDQLSELARSAGYAAVLEKPVRRRDLLAWLDAARTDMLCDTC